VKAGGKKKEGQKYFTRFERKPPLPTKKDRKKRKRTWGTTLL